jgi:hypothetical protein
MISENAKITPEMAMEELGIKQSRYYDLTKELGIKAHRLRGKAYLTEEQMQKLRDSKQPQNALATVDDFGEISLEEKEIIDEISEEEEEDIWRKAGEIKAKHLTAKDLLALHLAAGLGFKDLDPDLQEHVRTINAAANPENMGKSIAGTAQAMLEKRRSRQK